jgi:uncharacterized protein YeaO (DUF488 family)
MQNFDSQTGHAMTVNIKRVYELPASKDGYRVLVDRLWPRGISKETAGINEWWKEYAPSTKLRKWFGHDPVKWKSFRQQYLVELRTNRKELVCAVNRANRDQITLVYGAKDEQHNQAVVLKEFIETMMQEDCDQ